MIKLKRSLSQSTIYPLPPPAFLIPWTVQMLSLFTSSADCSILII